MGCYEAVSAILISMSIWMAASSSMALDDVEAFSFDLSDGGGWSAMAIAPAFNMPARSLLADVDFSDAKLLLEMGSF